MADITLSNGKELNVDLAKITVKQYRLLFDDNQTAEAGDETVARCLGLSDEELQGLSLSDYKLAMAGFFKRARDPLADPKGSASESISPS